MAEIIVERVELEPEAAQTEAWAVVTGALPDYATGQRVLDLLQAAGAFRLELDGESLAWSARGVFMMRDRAEEVARRARVMLASGAAGTVLPPGV